ncbi:hypothetical protein SAMN05421858_4388 [Haladaptatus litoreus]|uniref:Uncharacterized protein n=1 Tax=Haladaptatus litoreus TaxID=553468 RepID=A0A1N7ELZ0_9EURY|nr:hypothetical protein SAMN05421858_4388 [Haladaptatus litoreus]
MQLLEPLVHWPSLHLHRICDPPSAVNANRLSIISYQSHSENCVIVSDLANDISKFYCHVLFTTPRMLFTPFIDVYP